MFTAKTTTTTTIVSSTISQASILHGESSTTITSRILINFIHWGTLHRHWFLLVWVITNLSISACTTLQWNKQQQQQQQTIIPKKENNPNNKNVVTIVNNQKAIIPWIY